MTQLPLFERPDLLLPGSMQTPANWSGMCSWCGIRSGHDPAKDATWASSFTCWVFHAGTTERVCPFCVWAPTSLTRAIEIAHRVIAETGHRAGR